MFDPNKFDFLAKKIEKFEQILAQSKKTLQSLDSIASTLAGTFEHSVSQASKLLKKAQELKKETIELAAREAGITTKLYARLKFYDLELQNIDRRKDKISRILKLENDRFNRVQQQLRAELARNGYSQKALDLSEKLNKSGEKQKKLAEAVVEQDRLHQLTQSLQAIDKSNRKREQLLGFKSFAFDALGISKITNSLAPLAKFGLMLGLFAGAIAVLAFLIKSLVGTFREQLKTSIELGLDASQRMAQMSKANQVVAQGLRNGSLLSGSDILKAQDALMKQLGTLDIDNRVLQKSAELTRQIGISSEEASDLLSYFIRIRELSGDAAAYSATLVKAVALQNRMNPALIMRDVAANGANFAKSGKASADSMARAAVAVRQLGTSLGTIAGVADRLVTDFEGTLEAQANINAFVPGFNMTELLVASQFGTDRDIASALKTAVNTLGTDFENMPRSMKLAISNSLGIPLDEFIRINNGQMNDVSADASAIVTANKTGLNELQQAIVDPLASLNKGIWGIFAFVTHRFGSAADKAKAMTTTELKSKVDDSLSKPRIISLLRADPYITEYNNRVTSGLNVSAPNSKPIATSKQVSSQGVDSTVKSPSTQPQVTPVNTTGIEQRLDTLTALLKSGAISTNLDGKKVSAGLMEANKYGR
jgi:hypothetical protein